jgi:hypothetical protein
MIELGMAEALENIIEREKKDQYHRNFKNTAMNVVNSLI